MNREERRTYPRMRYSWPMYFARPGNGRCEVGRMIDLSEVAARFSVPCGAWVERGMNLQIRFSHPYVSQEDGYEVRAVAGEAQVLRVRQENGTATEVAVRLGQPLYYPILGQMVPG